MFPIVALIKPTLSKPLYPKTRHCELGELDTAVFDSGHYRNPVENVSQKLIFPTTLAGEDTHPRNLHQI